MTLGGVVGEVCADPKRSLIDRWNWKAALFSATLRATLFLCANLTAGWKAATAAMLAEFIYRACFSGFYGAITQALSKAEPAWDCGHRERRVFARRLTLYRVRCALAPGHPESPD
jgi:hypothetical protein